MLGCWTMGGHAEVSVFVVGSTAVAQETMTSPSTGQQTTRAKTWRRGMHLCAEWVSLMRFGCLGRRDDDATQAFHSWVWRTACLGAEARRACCFKRLARAWGLWLGGVVLCRCVAQTCRHHSRCLFPPSSPRFVGFLPPCMFTPHACASLQALLDSSPRPTRCSFISLV